MFGSGLRGDTHRRNQRRLLKEGRESEDGGDVAQSEIVQLQEWCGASGGAPQESQFMALLLRTGVLRERITKARRERTGGTERTKPERRKTDGDGRKDWVGCVWW